MKTVVTVLLLMLVATHLETARGQEQYCASGFEPGFAPKYCLAGACGVTMPGIPDSFRSQLLWHSVARATLVCPAQYLGLPHKPCAPPPTLARYFIALKHTSHPIPVISIGPVTTMYIKTAENPSTN
jgi:hypothetical protein